MNDDEANQQSEQKRTGLIDHANDIARRARSIQGAGNTLRHPQEAVNRLRGRFGAGHTPAGLMGGFKSPFGGNGGDSDDPEQKKKRGGGSPSDIYKDFKNAKKLADIALKIARVVPPQVWIVIGAVILVLIIYMIFFPGGSSLPFGGSDSSEQSNTPGENSYPPIPGLTIRIGGEEYRENGEVITYPITITYDQSIGKIPPDKITLFDILPSNTELESATPPYKINGNRVEWILSDVLSIQNLRISLRPTASNITVVNKVSATTTQALQGSSDNLSSNICTQPHEAGGYCSVENLKQYFNGDESKAIRASLICKIESGGNPFALNTRCDLPDANDYSVGLFQINAVASCEGAYDNLACTDLVDESKRTVCVQEWYDPEENIQQMLRLSQGGSVWSPWSAWAPAQNILRDCGQL